MFITENLENKKGTIKFLISYHFTSQGNHFYILGGS